MSNLGPNYQPFQPTPNQNYSPDPNYIPVQTSPNDGSISSRLASTRMVRIRIQLYIFLLASNDRFPFTIN